MEKNTLIKFCISLFLLCGHIAKRVCAAPDATEAQINLLNFIKENGHWEMMQFRRVKPPSDMFFSDCPEINNLQLISCSNMGCTYGVNLISFFSVAEETIGECNTLSTDLASHCMNEYIKKLGECKSVVLKLTNTLEFISSVIEIKANNNPFYRVLMELQNELYQGSISDEMFKGPTESFETFFESACFPSYSPLDIVTLRRTYDRSVYQNGVYGYFIYLLGTYLAFINEHLKGLGFRYDDEGNVTDYFVRD